MIASASSAGIERWPELPFEAWKDTAATLHMWMQIVGKIRLVQMPWINHSWHVTLYVSPRGLTTGAMPHGERTFQIDFDFIAHDLTITTSDDESRVIELKPRTTAEFYGAVMEALRDLELLVEIHASPNEVERATAFGVPPNDLRRGGEISRLGHSGTEANVPTVVLRIAAGTARLRRKAVGLRLLRYG